MSEEPIIYIQVGPPTRKEDQVRIGILHLELCEGGTELECAECRIPIWLGVKQMEYRAQHPEIKAICFECLKKYAQRGDKLDVRSSGGKGSTYVTNWKQ